MVPLGADTILFITICITVLLKGLSQYSVIQIHCKKTVSVLKTKYIKTERKSILYVA